MKIRLPHPYVMLLLAPLFWASSNVIGKAAKGLLMPAELTFYRWLLATLILSYFARHIIKQDLPTLKSRWLWLFIVGGSGFALFNIVLYTAFVQGASVIHVSIITALIPLGVVLFSALIFKEKISILQWLGIALAFLGVLVVVAKGHLFSLLHLDFARGDAIALLCTLIYVGYTLALRNSPQVHWASLMWAMCLAGLVVSIPFYGYGLMKHGFHMPSVSAVLLVIYVAIFVSIISKLFYMESVIQIGGARAALAMNLLPIFGSLLGVLFFADEHFDTYHFVALTLVMLGIFFSEWANRRKAKPVGISG